MLKTKFTFSPVVVNRYYRNVFSVKKIAFRNIKNAIVSYGKMSIAISLASLLNFSAEAQCNTFKNADAANPLLSVLPTGKKIAGFAFADIDGDGDEDVYIDFLGKPEAYGDTLHLYKNIGNKTHPVFKEDKNTGFNRFLAVGQNGEMQFVDIDGDGDLDYFASDSTDYYYNNTAYVYYYKNVGTAQLPRFIPANQDFLPVLGTRYIQPFAFADVDGDGDYDLYASDAGFYLPFAYNQRVYFNTGTPQHPVFNETDAVPSNEEDGALYRTYYDWNKDGLLDYFIVDDRFDYSIYYKNIGPKDNPQYVYNADDGPNLMKALPYRMIDLNNDGAPEVFDFGAHYSTLAPVAVIQDTVINNGSKPYTILSSKNRSANYTYRWEYNGTTIPGADKYYVVARQAGTYTLYVTGNCGTGVSLDYTIPKNGMPAEQANDRITAMKNAITAPFAVNSYPNPFTHTFTLQLSASDAQTESRIKITDLTGSVFLSQQMSASSLQVGQRLPRGTYIVQVWQKGELVYHTIMMKQ